MSEFVRFQVPKEVQEKTLQVLEAVKKDGKIKIGTNEATKCIEGGTAQLIVIAEDVTPPEIVMHLPLLCGEKGIPYTYVASKKELGQASGVEVSTAAAAVIKEGSAKNQLKQLITDVNELAKTGAKE